MPLEKTKSRTDLITDDQLLILTDPHSLEVEFYNNSVRNFSGIKDFLLSSNTCSFYLQLIHPEDYNDYLEHLRAFQKAALSEEKTILVRIRNKTGSWRKYYFKNRLYKGYRNDGKYLILSQAYEVPKDSESEEDCKEKDANGIKEIIQTEYQHLIDSLDEGFCIVELIYDTDGNPVDYIYLRTNPAFSKQVNFHNVTGKTVRELVERPQPHWLQTFAKVAATGESIRFQDHNKNLGNLWLDLYTFKVGATQDRRVAILFRDITDRKLAEEKLRKELGEHHKNLQESNDLLQTVFDTTNLGIVVFETLHEEDGSVKDFRFVRMNKVLQAMYEGKNVLGQTYLETTKYGVEMGMYDAFKKAMTTGEPFDKEFYFDKEGYNHWFRVTARPQKNLLIATLEDVTKRKAEAEELKENILFKQELVRTTPEVIMIINLNTFEVRYINKDILPEAGMTKENVQGKALPDILPYVHPRDREKVMDLHKKLLKSFNDEILDIEIRLKLQGTSWEWFNVRGKVFQRRDESWVDEYVLLVRNITEQKNTQKALVKAETLSIQGELARTFAHELRNPLASIGMVGEVLNKKLEGPQKEELKNYFKILQRSTKTINQLVTNLLNASNYSPAVLEKQDLAAIIEQTIEKAADRIYLAGINLVTNFQGPYLILADKEKLEIAILNIIVNASEAIIPGKGIIEIDITEVETDILLSIKDNGHGMVPEQIERLFEAFYTNKETGMGVGLSSVKNILEDHDAKIEVDSSPNLGTCFKIYFHNTEAF